MDPTKFKMCNLTIPTNLKPTSLEGKFNIPSCLRIMTLDDIYEYFTYVAAGGYDL